MWADCNVTSLFVVYTSLWTIYRSCLIQAGLWISFSVNREQLLLTLPKRLIMKIIGIIINNGNKCELQLYVTLLKFVHYALWVSTGKFFFLQIPIFILITLYSRSDFTSLVVHQIESVKNMKSLQVFTALTDGKIIFCRDYLHSFPLRAHSVR